MPALSRATPLRSTGSPASRRVIASTAAATAPDGSLSRHRRSPRHPASQRFGVGFRQPYAGQADLVPGDRAGPSAVAKKAKSEATPSVDGTARRSRRRASSEGLGRQRVGGAAESWLAASPAAPTASGQSGGARSHSFPPARLSCGIVVLLETHEILLCHVTGQRHWDLPKGGIHAGEAPRGGAARNPGGDRPAPGAEALLDIGRHAYTARRTCTCSPASRRGSTRASCTARARFVDRAFGPIAPGDGRLRLVRLRPHRCAVHAQAGGAADAPARPRRPSSSGSTPAAASRLQRSGESRR